MSSLFPRPRPPSSFCSVPSFIWVIASHQFLAVLFFCFTFSYILMCLGVASKLQKILSDINMWPLKCKHYIGFKSWYFSYNLLFLIIILWSFNSYHKSSIHYLIVAYWHIILWCNLCNLLFRNLSFESEQIAEETESDSHAPVPPTEAQWLPGCRCEDASSFAKTICLFLSFPDPSVII